MPVKQRSIAGDCDHYVGSCSWQGTASLHLKLHSKINFFLYLFYLGRLNPSNELNVSSNWVKRMDREGFLVGED